ncbi:MAG: FAD-binding oxidoreductase [Vulcanimicrobiaceae bacterium]
MIAPLERRLTDELRAIVGAPGVLTSEEDLLAYGYDGTWFESRPLVVVLPETSAQVSAIHKLASRERLALTPRAMRSGLSGGAVPLAGSIVLNVMRMNRILELDEINHVIVVQPGVINAEVQRTVEARGLFYPPDPSSLKQSAIGGNVAESAGGARCLKYGVTADYVAALEIVLPAGEVIRAGGMSSGLLPTSIELMDQVTLRCVEENEPLGLPVESDALLLFALDGNYENIVDAELEQIAEISRSHGATATRVAADAAESARLWQGRRSISPSLARKRPHRLGEDISVPRSEIVAMVRAVREIARRHELLIPLFGHAGDGNLHPSILCDRRDRAEMGRVRLAAHEIFAAAVALGGTLSGEHGIGSAGYHEPRQDLSRTRRPGRFHALMVNRVPSAT